MLYFIKGHLIFFFIPNYTYCNEMKLTHKKAKIKASCFAARNTKFSFTIKSEQTRINKSADAI